MAFQKDMDGFNYKEHTAENSGAPRVCVKYAPKLSTTHLPQISALFQ